MQEMRLLLGVLRTPHAETLDPTAPAPSLDHLSELLTRIDQAGVRVDLRVEGTPRALPDSIDRSAYRIIQEALTNTLKHGGPAHAAVTVRYDHGAVEVEVVDDGRGPPPGRPAIGGRGLVGMRERVSLYGGQLEVGARPEGGFRVHALLRDGGP